MIMKYLLIILTLAVTNLRAQTDLKFDKRFVECEDKWVAFQMNKDTTYNYGFIYIDSQAGLTLNYEGSFKISATGQYLPKKNDTTSIKVRLEPNNVLVSWIPESKYDELKIKAIPDWLKYYKTDTASVERLYRWGYMYNGWNECARALRFLEKAQRMNSKFQGLSVELAYSYNCLEQYDKAILVLQDALKANPTDAYVNKELIYAQIKSGQLDAASESCKKATKVCDDKTYNGENCYNLLYEYYKIKDKSNFYLWLKEAKKWTVNNADMTRNIKLMEDELKK